MNDVPHQPMEYAGFDSVTEHAKVAPIIHAFMQV